MIDDHAFFEQGKVTNKNLLSYFTVQAGDAYYRPLAKILPALGYMAFKSNPSGYHFMNLILLCLAAWGIYLFLTQQLKARSTCGFLAASLYVVHPINGLMVNYITASVFSAQVILMLLSLYFVIAGHSRRREQAWLFPAAACFSYLWAAFCHETAFALPFYAFILCLVLSNTTNISPKIQEAWSKTWPLFALLALLLMFRLLYAPLKALTLDKAGALNMSFIQYLATWTKLVWAYLSQLLFLRDIVLIMSQKILNTGPGLWLWVFFALLGGAGLLLWNWRRNRLLAIGLAWFILGFAPVFLACLFQPVHGLIMEPHWFVFPTIGFFMILACLLERFMRPKKVVAPVIVAMLILTCILSARWYNWIWADEVRYCSFWLQHAPNFVGAHAFLAEAYKTRGQYDLARRHYRQVLPLGFNLPLIYMNLGLMDLQEGKLASAEENFLALIKIDPQSSLTFNNLGAVYLKAGKYEQAKRYLTKALELDPSAAMPALNMQALNKILSSKPSNHAHTNSTSIPE